MCIHTYLVWLNRIDFGFVCSLLNKFESDRVLFVSLLTFGALLLCWSLTTAPFSFKFLALYRR